MHPSKFFDECELINYTKTPEELSKLREILKNIHPRNFIASRFYGVLFKTRIAYESKCGHIKFSEKYAIVKVSEESCDDLEMQARIMCEENINKYNLIYSESKLKNAQIIEIEKVATIVLPIG